MTASAQNIRKLPTSRLSMNPPTPEECNRGTSAAGGVGERTRRLACIPAVQGKPRQWR
jgi:hypothetical protein